MTDVRPLTLTYTPAPLRVLACTLGAWALVALMATVADALRWPTLLQSWAMMHGSIMVVFPTMWWLLWVTSKRLGGQLGLAGIFGIAGMALATTDRAGSLWVLAPSILFAVVRFFSYVVQLPPDVGQAAVKG